MWTTKWVHEDHLLKKRPATTDSLSYKKVIPAGEVRRLTEALRKAAYELNAIRARDGTPQIIHWDRGRPLQTDACGVEYFEELVEECLTVLDEAKQALSLGGMK